MKPGKLAAAFMLIAGAAAACSAAAPAAARSVIDCTVLADAASGKVLLQRGVCDQRVTSGSTFKIAISLMGYDSGFLRDAHAPALPFREGYVDWFPEWKQTTDPTAWMRDSVVWYSQQVTQSLGEERLQRYTSAFKFGNADVSGDPGEHNGLMYSWISSSLKISPLEQVSFLAALVNHQLPVSDYAVDMTARITEFTTLPNGWTVHGKAGSGSPPHDDIHNYGWFVGWAQKGTRTIVFARLRQDAKKTPGRAGLRVRSAFVEQLPAMLDRID
jgi:beta-lactamase class D